MSLATERCTLSPLEENATNMPVELFADRRALGIFGATTGSIWTPGGQETPQLAQSVDTEGALLVATTIGTRASPVIKFGVVEPLDPAGTNWALNPQSVSSGTAFTQVKASGASSMQLVRDLVGYDYAVLQVNPGTNSGEGVVSPAGTIPSPSGSLTAGVWLKGASGGEAVTLSLAAGTTVTSNVTLTSKWQWFTVTATSSAAPVFEVVGQGSVVLAFYATGWSIVPGATLANGFDGTFPGCSWQGAPHASQSTRPAAGGPRMQAIQADLEAAVKQISLGGGTIRRSLPSSSGGTFRITYDVLNAQLSWDDTEWQVGGYATGTLTCICEPYGRGPEMTVATDSFNPLISANYTVDAGALSNFSWGATGLSAASNLTTENRFLYQGEYPMFSGEVQATFTPKATISGFKGGVILERGDSTDYLEGYVTDNGTSSFLKVDKIVAGSRTNVLSATLASRIVNGTAYTVRLRTQRQNNVDNVYAEYFISAAPGATTAPTNTLGPYVITDAIFSALTPGSAGIVFTPQTSAALATSLIISPYLARERTLPVLRFGLAGVPGTAPGLGRMIVQDDSGNDQYWTRWGQQHDRLSRMASTTDFFYEAEALTPVNGASVVTGNAGASGGNVVRQTGLTNTFAAMLTTQLTGGGAQLAHIGDFEVWARVFNAAANTGTVDLALRWSTGDLEQFIVNTAVPEPTKGSYAMIKLGTVHLPTTTAGTQQWQGQILANSTHVGDTLDIDNIFLVPLTDGGATVVGVASAPTVSVFTARDEFLQGSPTITGAALPVGGTWATSGSTAGDFIIDTTNHAARRNGFSDSGGAIGNGRLATASSSTLAGVGASVDVGAVGVNGEIMASGLVLRYVNATNYAVAAVQVTLSGGNSGLASIVVAKIIGGTATNIAGGTVPNFAVSSSSPPPFMTLQATIDAAGRATAYWGPVGGPYAFVGSGSDSALATGGTLASGLCGLYSWEFGGLNAFFDNFWAESFTGDAAFYSGRQFEVRSDRSNRQNSGGTIWTPPSSYVGQYMRVPTPAFYDGVDNLLVKASRNDPTFANDPGIDAIEAQVNITPRWATVPNG
jgi:hypothetical protein